MLLYIIFIRRLMFFRYWYPLLLIFPQVVILQQSFQSGHLKFVEIDHDIISKAILSLPLIQERHLSVTGEKYVH